MVQNRFTTGKMIDLNLLGTDDSIEAGGAVTTGNPRTRVFYDASVEAGGTDVDPNSNKPRVFYDTSVTAGGTGTGPNSNKPHVFYDTSITAGGDGIGGKSGPKYLYDNSIESGGAPSKPKTDELHVAPIDVTKMVDLWNWLEDNQTDMRRFLEPQGGQSDAGIHYIDEDLSGAYKRNRRYHDDT